MHGSANSNIFETHLKCVTPHSAEKRKQTIAMAEVYRTNSNIFSKSMFVSVAFLC